MKFNWREELWHWLFLAGMFLAAAIVWNQVPDRMPTHWNASGEVDGYGNRFVGLLLLPLTTLGLYVLLLVVPYLDPGKTNYEGFRSVYRLIRLTFMVYMTLIYAATLRSALGYPVDMARVISFLMGGMLVILGNSLGKIRPNWFVGVRTPWTLSSKLSWSKSHRLAGWLFVGAGLATCFSGVFWPKAGVFVLLGTLLPSSLAVVIYSYFVWRSDPERISPAGTTPASTPSAPQ